MAAAISAGSLVAVALAAGPASPASAVECAPSTTAYTPAPSTGVPSLTAGKPVDTGTPTYDGTGICVVAGDSQLVEYTFKTDWLVKNEGGLGVPHVTPPAARIILPSDYATAPNKHYPVVYLLHGGAVHQLNSLGSGSGLPALLKNPQRAWTDGELGGGSSSSDAGTALTAVQQVADKKVIVVMPSGSDVGMWTDWKIATNGSGAPTPRYESFLTKQLIPWVDQNFRTWNTAQYGDTGRAIAGNSMGGMGALTLTFRNPALFSLTGSFSGSNDIEDTGYGPFVRPPLTTVYSNGLWADSGNDLNHVYQGNWMAAPFYMASGGDFDAKNPMKKYASLAGEDVWLSVGANDLTKPRTAAGHCQFSGTTAAAVGESLNCVVNEKLDGLLTSNSVAMTHYSYTEVQGKKHDWGNWNGVFPTWLGYAVTKLKPAA